MRSGWLRERMMRTFGPVFRTSTLEQLSGFIAPTWQALIDGAKYVNPRLTEIFDEVQPDVIVEDNVVAFPAITASGRPWVRIVSCNPMEMKDPEIAPFSSGYPVDDRRDWADFLHEVRRTHTDMWQDFDEFCRANGEHGLSYGELGPEFIAESPYLNLYSYPAEADYRRFIDLNPTWHRLDSTVRAPDTTWELPEHLRDRPLLRVQAAPAGVPDAAAVAVPAGEDAAARRRAHRGRRVETVEAETGPREPIEVRRPDERVAEVAEVAEPQVVRHHEDDVRPLPCRGGGREERDRDPDRARDDAHRLLPRGGSGSRTSVARALHP